MLTSRKRHLGVLAAPVCIGGLSTALLSVACGGPTSEEAVGSVQPEGLNPRHADAGGQALTEAAADRVACEAQFLVPPPDCDPVAPFTWDIDCDADGSPGAQMTACEPDQLLVHSPRSAPGRFDCDDQNAALNPGAMEVWGDEIDSDCDGAERPTCVDLESGAYEVQPNDDNSPCEGAGAALLDFAACAHPCDEGEPLVFVVFTNQGSEETDPLALEWQDSLGEGGTLATGLALAPGEVSDAIGVPYAPERGIELHLVGDSCADVVSALLEPARTPCVR